MDPLPSDIWAEILLYLPYSGIKALLECGNRVLMARISVSWKVVTVPVSLGSIFPFWAFNLPQISELNIYSDTASQNCVLRLNHAVPLPTKPVLSLQKLTLKFAQSLAIFRPTSPSNSLSALLPNLTELHLADCANYWTSSMFTALPRGLQTLSVRINRGLPQCKVHASDFEYLPRGLQNLSLSVGEVLELCDDDWKSLPPTLKKLKVDSITSSAVFMHLPTSIEVLSLAKAGRDRFGETDTFSVSILPSSLRRLTCHHYTFVLDAPLPPLLEIFTVKISTNGRSMEDLSTVWPKSMTVLPSIAITSHLLSHSFSERFPKLSKLALTFENAIIMREILDANNSVFPLPQSLTHLTIPRLGHNILSLQIPPTLKMLVIDLKAGEEIRNLPATLATLNLDSNDEPGIPPIFDDWKQLPSGITSLSCSSWMLRTPEILSAFGRLTGLKSLSISHCSNDWLSHSPESYLWPGSLTKLTIHGARQQNFNWLSSLESLEHLVEVKLSGSVLSPEVSTQLSKLPRRLKHLTMSWIPSEGLSGLPLTLTALVLLAFDYPTPCVSLEMLATLPKSLNRLLVPKTTLDDIPALCAALPPRIHAMTIFSDQHKDLQPLYREYYGKTEWEGALDTLFVKPRFCFGDSSTDL